MKTKDKYKKSLSRTGPDQTSTARPRAAGRTVADDSSSSGFLHLSIAKSREQSENVYEIKGQVQKVAESYSAVGSSYKQTALREDWDAIVIGSGMGGLATAALLARYGRKRVLVLERHYVAGGFTHAFHRLGYEWDVGVHYIGQVQTPGSPLRAAFDNLSDGRELRAPIVVSDAGAWNTFSSLLPPAAPGVASALKELSDLPPSKAHLCLYVGVQGSDATVAPQS